MITLPSSGISILSASFLEKYSLWSACFSLLEKWFRHLRQYCCALRFDTIVCSCCLSGSGVSFHHLLSEGWWHASFYSATLQPCQRLAPLRPSQRLTSLSSLDKNQAFSQASKKLVHYQARLLQCFLLSSCSLLGKLMPLQSSFSDYALRIFVILWRFFSTVSTLVINHLKQWLSAFLIFTTAFLLLMNSRSSP